MEKHIHKILSLETSGKTLSLALLESSGTGPRTLGEIFLDAGYRHSGVLSEACQFLVRAAGLAKEDLTCLAVSTGPGSFTGLRVGIAYARTLSQFLKIPLIGVPVFEILNRQAAKDPDSRGKWTCVAIESIGKEVYFGVFKPGSQRPAGPYQVLSAQALEKKLAKLRAKKVLSPSSHPPQAKVLGEIALERAGRASAKNWHKVVPFYLRAPIAVERAGKQRKHK